MITCSGATAYTVKSALTNAFTKHKSAVMYTLCMSTGAGVTLDMTANCC